MATEADASTSSSLQKVSLQYEDGTVIETCLELNVLQQLQKSDSKDALMNEIRQNVELAERAKRSSSQARRAAPEDVEEMSEDSDVEESSSTTSTYTTWTREAVMCLISLYEENEEDMENPLRKKKDVWKSITVSMNKRGHVFSQNKVESKWRSLVLSHKNVSDNKSKTGGKRKNFQFFVEMEQLLAKRHDINPPFVAGSACDTSSQKSTIDPSTSKGRNNPGTDPSICDTSRGEDDSTCDSNSDSESSLALSSSQSAMTRRKMRKHNSTGNFNHALNLLQELENQRKEEYKQREDSRNARAKERNDLLREFLEVLKK